MLIKRLSKIGLTLLLAVSFLMPVSFDARADFTSTDSHNLDLIEENTSNTYSRLGTTNTRISEIKTELVSLNTEVSNIKTAVANTITTTLNQINTKIGNIYSAVDQLEGYLDTVETKLGNVADWLDTVNGNIVTMGNYVQAINNNESANGNTLTNIYNYLNSYLGAYLNDIRSPLLILNDNIRVGRVADSASTITVSNNATLGNVTYNLNSFKRYTYSVSNFQITVSEETKYGNFAGILFSRLQEVKGLLYNGFNLTGSAISAFATQVYTDLGYIGDELHLTYQLLNAFKTANHNDIQALYDYISTYVQQLLYLSYVQLADAIVSETNSVSQTFNGTTYSIHLVRHDILSTPYYFNLRGLLHYYFNTVVVNISNPFNRSAESSDDENIVVTLNRFPVVVHKYLLPSYDYSIQNQEFTYNNNYFYSTFTGMIFWSYRNFLYKGFQSYFKYLSDNSAANTIRQSVTDLSTNLTNLNNAETAASTDAISRINSFVPNISDISSLVALSWCSTFLQNLYLALGTFNIPILCGLVLAVCMQFIGYFRYKT